MGDGRARRIRYVKVGDEIRGAFGEINRVLGLDRPLLGERALYRINGHHWTTDDHPYLSRRGFLAVSAEAYYERDAETWYDVILGDGVVEKRLNVGLPPGRVKSWLVGLDELRFHDHWRLLSRVEPSREFGPETQLYNLVIDGSHTYRVDGYTVTGWPKVDDFDYDAWRRR